MDDLEARFLADLKSERWGLERRALKLTRNWHDAEDLLSTTYGEIWKSYRNGHYNFRLPPGPWMSTILRYTYFKMQRKKRPPAFFEAAESSVPSAEDQFMAQEAIRYVLQQGSSDLWARSNGVYLQDLANMRGISFTGMHNRIKRERAKLRTAIDGDVDDERF